MSPATIPIRARGLEAAWQRLGCNLLMVAAEGLPRGGKLTLAPEDGAVGVAAIGEGDGAVPREHRALTLAAPVEALTSRTVGAYFAGLFAQTLGLAGCASRRSRADSG